VVHRRGAQFRKRMWHGLTLDGSYTWSQLLDTQSGPLIFNSVPLSTYNGDNITDKGKSNLDQTQRGVVELCGSRLSPEARLRRRASC